MLAQAILKKFSLLKHQDIDICYNYVSFDEAYTVCYI